MRDDNTLASLRKIICETIVPDGKEKKGGQIQDLIAERIGKLPSFRVDKEDKGKFLAAGLPVWRDRDSLAIERTRGRRKIDIVVYDGIRPLVLIEVESDLDDLKPNGVNKRNNHYDVFSIAHSEQDAPFYSYKSLERMAAAAFYYSLKQRSNGAFTDAEAVASIAAIKSNDPNAHNPSGIPIFLVTVRCRPDDEGILKRRLNSLGAELICLT